MIGAFYSDYIMFATTGMIGCIELGLIVFCWLLEILCGRYGWRPRFSGRRPRCLSSDTTHSSEEPAWQHYFSATRLTRLCFASSASSDGYIGALLTSGRTAWLGWAVCFLFLLSWIVMTYLVYSAWVWDLTWDYTNH